MSTAIVVGSARSPGNTHRLARRVSEELNATLFDLADYTIGCFDYAGKNSGDDFLPLMKVLLDHEHLVLASPVYWYAPSSVMKAFLDRWSDLLKFEKDLGRQLRKKSASVLATGCDEVPAPCYEEIYRRSFAHLGMSYRGMLYCACPGDIDLGAHELAIAAFAKSFLRGQELVQGGLVL